MLAAKSDASARKELASERGHVHLEVATKYFDAGDTAKARRIAEEGIRLTCGPFYLAVSDQLHDLLERIRIADGK